MRTKDADPFRKSVLCCDHMTGATATDEEMSLFDGCYDLIKSDWWTIVSYRLPYEESMSVHGEIDAR